MPFLRLISHTCIVIRGDSESVSEHGILYHSTKHLRLVHHCSFIVESVLSLGLYFKRESVATRCITQTTLSLMGWLSHAESFI